MSIMLGNMGGLVGSNIYLEREAPSYWSGYGVSAACLATAIVCTFVLRYVWARANAVRDNMSEVEIRSRYTDRKSKYPEANKITSEIQSLIMTVEELLDMGDRSPLYRYVL